MDNRSFWNEISKYGLMLGVVMGALTIFMHSLVINTGAEHAGILAITTIIYITLFFVILRHATRKRAAQVDPAKGFTYTQSVNYMILVAIFAAVPAAFIYYVYINSIIGYDNYIDGLASMLVTIVETQAIDAKTADLVEELVEQVHHLPQASIFKVLFNNIIQYAFAGMFAGLLMSGFIARKPQIPSTNEEQ